MYTGQIASFSNREDWEFPIMDIIDDDTGDALDLSDSTISYGIYDANKCVVVSGTTGDGTITLTDDTSFQILVPRSTATSQCAGSYTMGITVENADITKSLFAGTITVLDGSVPA